MASGYRDELMNAGVRDGHERKRARRQVTKTCPTPTSDGKSRVCRLA